MSKSPEFTVNSPFNLENSGAYSKWREQKLATAELALKYGFTEISDPLNLSDSEKSEILSRCQETNMALYSIPTESDDSVLRKQLVCMAGSLGMGLPEGHRSAGDQGIVALTVSNRPSQLGFIPYTRNAINWHTDGYYNAPENTIRSFILHCKQNALEGGVNQAIDSDITYIRLRDENPDFITALMHPEAMTIPESPEPDGSVRPVSVGPVYAIEGDDLIMRYTARTRSIEWRDNPVTREAVAFLQNLMVERDPLMREVKLEPDQGIFNNNVPHTRTAFDPDEVGNTSRRIMYRVRFNNRIGSI